MILTHSSVLSPSLSNSRFMLRLRSCLFSLTHLCRSISISSLPLIHRLLSTTPFRHCRLALVIRFYNHNAIPFLIYLAYLPDVSFVVFLLFCRHRPSNFPYLHLVIASPLLLFFLLSFYFHINLHSLHSRPIRRPRRSRWFTRISNLVIF